MAYLDHATGKIVVRVVFDGAAMSGKTTNVRALSDTFRERCVGEMQSPGTVADRTHYLDWLRVDTGLVQGCKLSCHFLTVPGQQVLARRRRYLLGLADVVVFVASAERASLSETVWAFRFLERFRAAQDAVPPLFLQLNKCDLPGAMSEAELRAALSLAPEVRVLSAQAERGVGVRETVVFSIRAAADRVQDQILMRGIDSLEVASSSAEELQAAIDDAEKADGRTLLEVVADAGPLTAPAPTVESPGVAGSRGSLQGVPESATVRRGELPVAEVMGGLIWPPNNGRSWLARALGSHPELEHRGETVVRYRSTLYEFVSDAAHDCASTSEAQERIVQLARAALSLGPVSPSRLVLVAACERDGRAQLWRALPHLGTLEDALDYALGRGDRASIDSLMALFVASLRQAQKALERLSLGLQVSLGNFCLQGERLVYTGTICLSGPALQANGALLTALERLGAKMPLVTEVLVLVGAGLGTPRSMGLASEGEPR